MGRENSVSETLGTWFASVMGPESVAERITAKGRVMPFGVVSTCKVTGSNGIMAFMSTLPF